MSMLSASNVILLSELAHVGRAVVKSTFVESKTRTIESESRPNPKRFESKSSPSPKRFESKSSPSPNETVKTEKEIKNLLQNHILIYNLCDTRDSISSILR